MRCIKCGGSEFRATDDKCAMKIAGRTFSGDVPAEQCTTCGESYVRGPNLGRWERAIVEDLVAHGPLSGEALSFIRRAAGFQAKEIARLLGVTPETVSRWEHGKRPVDRASWLAVGTLVTERLAGRSDTVDRLKALEKPPRKRVRLNLRAA